MIGHHQIEVIQWDGKQQVFLNLLICPIDAPPESIITLRYSIQGQNYQGKATILEGGQRLLIRDEDGERMIDAWYNDEDLNIPL